MYTTRVSRHLDAPPLAVYRTLLDPEAVARWRVPYGMSCRVHEFDAREGGAFRVSLRYEGEDGAGKSGPRTDTYHGRFVELVPDERAPLLYLTEDQAHYNVYDSLLSEYAAMGFEYG
ncbi:SRPBCC domain-containing protein, partial [Streptomyces sp. NPDC000963]